MEGLEEAERRETGLVTCLVCCSPGSELGQALVQGETGKLSGEHLLNSYLVPRAKC